MKICSKCFVSKPKTEFVRRRDAVDGLRGECKTCRSSFFSENKERVAARKAKWQKENRDKCIASNRKWDVAHPGARNAAVRKWRHSHPGAYLGPKRQANVDRVNALKESSACSDCGGLFPACSMDFDHVHGKKHREVGALVYASAPWATIQAEIDKCELVCANCHRIRTRDKGSSAWTRQRITDDAKPAGIMWTGGRRKGATPDYAGPERRVE